MVDAQMLVTFWRGLMFLTNFNSCTWERSLWQERSRSGAGNRCSRLRLPGSVDPSQVRLHLHLTGIHDSRDPKRQGIILEVLDPACHGSRSYFPTSLDYQNCCIRVTQKEMFTYIHKVRLNFSCKREGIIFFLWKKNPACQNRCTTFHFNVVF